MWVRIDEISFAADRAEDEINHVRNNAVHSTSRTGTTRPAHGQTVPAR
jgi:hypothetical protein